MTGEKKYPTPFQRAACWHALTWACVLFLVIVACGLLYGLVRAFVALESVLLPVIIAGVLAYLLNPIVNWLQARIGCSRVLAVLPVMLGAGVVVGIFGYTVVPPLVNQTQDLIQHRAEYLQNAVDAGKSFLENTPIAQTAIDTLYKRMQDEKKTEGGKSREIKQDANEPKDYTGKLIAILEHHSDDLISIGIRWLTAGTKVIYGSVGFLIGIVLIPVFLFYFLLESEGIKEKWHDVLPIRASRFRDEVVGTLRDINTYVVSFVRGQMLVSLIDGVVLGCALMIMGLPHAVTIGVAAALLGIIPYIGMITVSVPALLLAWSMWHDAGHVAAVLAIFLSVSQLDGWVLQPKILGTRLHMHDLTVMFSVLFWGSILGGIVGALLAVPLTASLKVLFKRYVWLERDKQQIGVQ